MRACCLSKRSAAVGKRLDWNDSFLDFSCRLQTLQPEI